MGTDNGGSQTMARNGKNDGFKGAPGFNSGSFKGKGQQLGYSEPSEYEKVEVEVEEGVWSCPQV